MGGFRPDEKDFCFVIYTMIHSSSYIQRISINLDYLLGEPINVWVAAVKQYV